MSEEKSAAIVTIKDAAKMSKKSRKQVAAWLRRQADCLIECGDELAGRFTARYLYTEGNKKK
jgi:hypothetical protein